MEIALQRLVSFNTGTGTGVREGGGAWRELADFPGFLKATGQRNRADQGPAPAMGGWGT